MKERNTPCMFFLRGSCKKGGNCNFSHSEFISLQERLLCSYHIQGNCRYGEHCQLIHGNICLHCNKPCLHPHNPSQADHHIKLCEQRNLLLRSLPSEIINHSNKVECGICLEVVMDKGRRFGLMAGCEHGFCLSCIRAWRSTSRDTTNPSIMVKTCPTCRRESLFVIPSSVFVGGELKLKMAEQYKNNLRNKPCRYYEKTGSCPFGGDCFYAHLDADGSPVDSSKMVNVIKNRKKDSSPTIPFGLDIIDLLSHVSDMHPSHVMELLMDLLANDAEENDWFY